MAQTLAAVIEPVAPITIAMRNAIKRELTKLENLGRPELKAFTVVCLTYLTGNTGYKTTHKQLIEDAEALLGGTSIINDTAANVQVIQLQAVLAWQQAFATDPTISTSVNTLLLEARYLKEYPEETLNRAIFLLWLKAAI